MTVYEVSLCISAIKQATNALFFGVWFGKFGRASKEASRKLQNWLTLQVPETKIAEFANSVDLDEVAHNEPPHQDLHCLPSSL